MERSSVSDERRLQRVAADPTPANPPLSVAWARRQTDLVGAHQYRITVACELQAAVESGVHAVLTGELHRRWIARPAPRRSPMSSVVAAFDAHRGRYAQLTLAITTAAPEALQDPQMGHDLTDAVACALSAKPLTF